MSRLPPQRPLRSELLQRLALAGGWLRREQLEQVPAPLAYSRFVVDNELADLVMQQQVLFNPRSGEYRLGGGPLARKALQRLVQQGERRTMLGHQAGALYRVGLAQRVRDASGDEMLVSAELELDYPGTVPGVLALMRELQGWVQ